MSLRKPTRSVLFKRLKKECHRLWSLAVRRRDKKCILCQSIHGLNAHHWIVHARGSLATRFLVLNGVTLCYACHIYKVHGRGDAETFDIIKEYMKRYLHEQRYFEIKQLGHGIAKMTVEDLQKIESGLRIMAGCERGLIF